MKSEKFTASQRQEKMNDTDKKVELLPWCIRARYPPHYTWNDLDILHNVWWQVMQHGACIYFKIQNNSKIFNLLIIWDDAMDT